MHPSVWLLRHAESTFNASQGALDQVDCGLTPQGHAQAAALAAAPPWRPAPPTHVYVSPLRRAQETLAPLRPTLAATAQVETLPLLREFRIDRCDTLRGEPLDVETASACRARASALLAWLREEVGARRAPGDVVLVVGHGDIFHAITGVWMGNAEAAQLQ